MLVIPKKIFSLFNRKERGQIYLLFFGMVIRGLVEVAGVASIMPFITVVSDPNMIFSNQYLHFAYSATGVDSPRIFLLLLGFAVFVLILINNMLSALTDWYLFRFTWLQGYSLSKHLLAKYLSKDYGFFLGVNTAELGANILSEVSYFIKGILKPFMEMAAKLIICIFIFILLFLVDHWLATIVGGVLGSAYLTIFLIVRRKLSKIGKQRAFHNRRQFMYINESLGGIKDIKVKGCEHFFLHSFSENAYKVNMTQATHQIVSQFPKYALETIAFGGILLIILYLVLVNKSTEDTIPLMALYAFAGYRLMPSLQSVFVGVANVRFNLPTLERLYDDLMLRKEDRIQIPFQKQQSKRLDIGQGISLENITFSYPKSQEMVLNDLNLKISPKTTVGLVGTTGAGKTTVVDLILGLLDSVSGEVKINGHALSEELKRGWRANIGYVPQQIFLADQSIKQNIALGVQVDEISDEAVMQAARIANLHDFIENELEEGYETIVGERGVRLSGGQRQRLGIARALYHDPDVLILDEATSALDNITEKQVMRSLDSLNNRKTIVMIAHRLSTLENCDEIHFMSAGRVIGQGNYASLLETCSEFKKLVEAKVA